MKQKAFLLSVLVLPLLIYIPHLGEFPYPSGSIYSDITVSHYPNALYVQESLAKYGQIPLWSELILSGYPFVANPLSGLFYPPGWLAFFVPLPAAFNILILLHLLWGGWGMICFLRSNGLELYPALLGGLIFELMPKLFGHYAAGHITLIFAVCWTPWLLHFQANADGRAKKIIPSLIFATIILADVRWAAYSGGLWFVFAFSQWWASLDKNPLQLSIRTSILWLLKFLGQLCLSLLFAAPFILPFIEYVSLSTRGSLGQADNLAFSLSPLNLIGLLIPDFGGYAEWIIYPGALSSLIFFGILAVKDLRRRNRFWINLIFFCILLALGSNFPITSWIFSLPGFHFLRVPSRIMFIAGLAFAFLAATGFQWWLRMDSLSAEVNRKRLALWIFMLNLVVWMLFIGMWFVQDEFPIEFAWGSVALTGISLIFWFFLHGKINKSTFVLSTIVIVIFDLGIVNYSQINFRSSEEILSQHLTLFDDSTLNQLKQGRVYAPDYDTLPQELAAMLNLKLAEGADPMQLMDYVEFFSRASGIPILHYSITVPPLAEDLGATNYEEFIPDSYLLGKLGVNYILMNFEGQLPGFTLVKVLGELFIYKNLNVFPQARIQEDLSEALVITPATIVEDTPNQVDIQAKGPGYLITTGLNYPGWKVYVDGKAADILEADGLFRSVKIGGGDHKVSFVFLPDTLALGFLVLLITIVGICGYYGGTLLRANRRRPSKDEIKYAD